MLEAGLTLWQALLALFALVTPGVVGLSKLYGRVGILEERDKAKETLLATMQARADAMARDVTDIKTTCSEIKTTLNFLKEREARDA